MKPFKHKRKTVEFRKVTGTILDQSKFSETRISSSGGGGHVGQHGGYVRAPSIHSSTITNQEFWLLGEDGTEKAIQLSDSDIPLRPGQRVTLIMAGLEGEDHAYYSILVNHNTNEHWFIKDGGQLNSSLKINEVSGKSLLFAIAIGITVGLIGGSSDNLIGFTAGSLGVGVSAAFGFLMFRAIVKVKKIKKMARNLTQHLELLAQSTYEK